MCYHAQQTKTSTEVQQRFNTKGEAHKGVFNGFSHPGMSVITAASPNELQSSYWGLIPKSEASWLAGEVPDPFYEFQSIPVN